MIDINNLWSMQEDSDVLSIYTLKYQNVSFQSFTFYPLEVIVVLLELDTQNWSVAEIIRVQVLSMKSNIINTEERKLYATFFKNILAQLINIVHLKINDFPFHYKTSKETTAWFNGLYINKFGIYHLIPISNPTQIILRSQSKNSDYDSDSQPTER